MSQEESVFGPDAEKPEQPRKDPECVYGGRTEIDGGTLVPGMYGLLPGRDALITRGTLDLEHNSLMLEGWGTPGRKGPTP